MSPLGSALSSDGMHHAQVVRRQTQQRPNAAAENRKLTCRQNGTGFRTAEDHPYARGAELEERLNSHAAGHRSVKDADLPRIGKHPAGVYLLAVVEFWERFSFWGLSGLLILYLVADVAQGGLQLDRGDALRLVGIFGGCSFAAPALGGWISSRWWGERRSITRGAILIMTGHVVLALQPLVPFEHRFIMLIAALVIVICGTGLLKPTISSIVGGLYEDGKADRNVGFVIFTMGVWGGSLICGPIIGTLGERVSWHTGFLAAAIGMGIALLLYLWLNARLLGDVGLKPNWKMPESTAASTAASGWTGVVIIGIFSVFTIVYTLCFFQYSGALSLYLKGSVDRGVGGAVVPVTWFLSITELSFIVAAPLITLHLARASYARGFGVLARQAVGLTVIAGAFGMFWLSTLHAPEVRGPLLPVVAGYILMGLADVFIWPAQLSAITLLAPRRYTSFALGVWFVASGVGIFFTGFVAVRLGGAAGEARLFAALALMALAAAGLVLIARAVVVRRTSISPI